MAEGMYSIYHTNPPMKMPRLKTVHEARRADRQALSLAWRRSISYVAQAYQREKGAVNA